MDIHYGMIELTDAEIDEVAGGGVIIVVGIVVGAIALGGLVVGIYNGFQEEKTAAKATKPT